MNDPILVLTDIVLVQGVKKSHDITQTARQTACLSLLRQFMFCSAMWGKVFLIDLKYGTRNYWHKSIQDARFQVIRSIIFEI